MVKVLYVLGSSRCGSTVLADILGEIDGVFAAGEVRYLWDRVLQSRRCGCGQPVDRCEVWQAVLPTTDVDRNRIRRLSEARRQALRLHRTPALLRLSSGRLGRSATLRRCVDAMSTTYRVLSEVTGADVIVDSSKRPSNAACLRLMPGVDPYLLHVVRDPRGVAYSRLRRKKNPDGAGEMPVISSRYSALDWVATNVAAEDVTHAEPHRSMLLRYEDFVSEPKETIRRIAARIGKDLSPNPFVDEHTVDLGSNHTVSGNPDRFDRGLISLRPDVAWMDRLSAFDRRLTTSLTLPLLLRYGYPIKPTRPPVPGAGSSVPSGVRDAAERGDGGGAA